MDTVPLAGQLRDSHLRTYRGFRLFTLSATGSERRGPRLSGTVPETHHRGIA